MRSTVLFASLIALLLVAGACQGEVGPKGDQGPQGPQGPEGPAGPPGEVASIDETIMNAVVQQMTALSSANLTESRLEDSDRIDNIIHAIIENTQDPAFKERLAGLDREIHRVFNAVKAASQDEQTTQSLELMEGLVVLSAIMIQIAEARLEAAQ